MQTILTQTEGKQGLEQARAHLLTFIHKIKEAGPEGAHQVISQMRVKLCHEDQDIGVVMWSASTLMEPADRAILNKSIMDLLRALKAEMTFVSQRRLDILNEMMKESERQYCESH